MLKFLLISTLVGLVLCHPPLSFGRKKYRRLNAYFSHGSEEIIPNDNSKSDLPQIPRGPEGERKKKRYNNEGVVTFPKKNNQNAFGEDKLPGEQEDNLKESVVNIRLKQNNVDERFLAGEDEKSSNGGNTTNKETFIDEPNVFSHKVDNIPVAEDGVLDSVRKVSRFTIRAPPCDSSKNYYPDIFLNDHETLQVFSPNYPLRYNHNSDCGWTLWTSANKTFKIDCPVYEMDTNDYVAILDMGKTRTLQFQEMQNFTTLGNMIILSFFSNAYQSGKGFFCVLKTVPDVSFEAHAYDPNLLEVIHEPEEISDELYETFEYDDHIYELPDNERNLEIDEVSHVNRLESLHDEIKSPYNAYDHSTWTQTTTQTVTAFLSPVLQTVTAFMTLVTHTTSEMKLQTSTYSTENDFLKITETTVISNTTDFTIVNSTMKILKISRTRKEEITETLLLDKNLQSNPMAMTTISNHLETVSSVKVVESLRTYNLHESEEKSVITSQKKDFAEKKTTLKSSMNIHEIGTNSSSSVSL